MQGIIVKALSGFYYVKAGEEIIECKAKGVFRNKGVSPLVGDRVEIETDGNSGTVCKILPRKNFLLRPPVANIDKAFIISSYENPKPNTTVIDTMTSICEYNGIKPIIVFNKSDMGDFSQYREIYSRTGYKVIVCCSRDKSGIDEIKSETENCVSVFTGNSGVGKSSILNALEPALLLKTGEVSEKLGRGRHTTRHTQLFKAGNGLIADTAGFSSLETDRNDYGYKENLAQTFIEFTPFLNSCRFSDCTHTAETGCAVLQAVEEGVIPISRHKSYVALYNELKDLKPWQISKNSNCTPK